jgi:hypothetical protein
MEIRLLLELSIVVLLISMDLQKEYALLVPTIIGVQVLIVMLAPIQLVLVKCIRMDDVIAALVGSIVQREIQNRLHQPNLVNIFQATPK